MEQLILSLADIPVAVSSPGLSRFFAGCGGFDRFMAPGLQPLWHVRFGQPQQPWSDALLLSSFRFEENGCQCLFLRRGDSYQFLMRPHDPAQPPVCLTHRRGSHVVDISSCSDISSWRFSLWFAISLLGADTGITFVHSSVIVFRHQAVLFLGESGTGKSTHTRLWLQSVPGSRLLNDDSPLLSLSSGAPIVYGSPWSGKTPVFVPLQFPLKSIVRLSQAPYNAIRHLSPLQSFGALQPSLPPALMQDDGLRIHPTSTQSSPKTQTPISTYADSLVELISKTLAHVPVYHLQCLPNVDAARLCAETLFGAIPPPETQQ